MESVILVAGKRAPASLSLADGISLSGRRIALASQPDGVLPEKRPAAEERRAKVKEYEAEKAEEAQNGLCRIPWTPSSSLSARSLVIQTLAIFGRMDEALLYFDEEWFASKALSQGIGEVGRTCDEMISGYQYLTLELLSLFENRGSGGMRGALIFLLKDTPSRLDVLKDSALDNGLNSIASPIVSAAKAAFASFAENIAAQYRESAFVDVILMRGNGSREGFRRDDETGRWICLRLKEFRDAARGTAGKEQGAASAVEWITAEPGAQQEKRRGLSSLFGRRHV